VSHLVTVARKEWAELFAERHSRRAMLVQSLFAVLVLGVLNPLASPEAWQHGSAAAALTYLFFPGFLASTVAADAFAGERERRTLETLLATPLSEWAILLGKAAAAVGFALLLACAGALAALVTMAVTAGGLAIAPSLIAGLLAAACASALALTSVAVLVSLRVPVARSAQQLTALGGLVLAAAVGATWRLAGADTSWRTLTVTELALVALAGIVFAAARTQFRRERLLEH